MRPRRTRHLYRRLLREARPFGMHITGLMGLGALSSVFALLTPLPLKLVVDSSTLAAGLVLTLFMGALGGLVPSLSAMRLRPLESLR